MTKWCVFCPEPRRAIGEVDGDPVCVLCGAGAAQAGAEFVRYKEVLKPAPSIGVVHVERPRGQGNYGGGPRKGTRCWSRERERRLALLHAAIREHVGKMPDRQVALRVGCHKDTVADFRKRHGIPAFHAPVFPSPWVAEANRRRGERTWQKIAPYVGKMTDKAIAQILGITASAVGHARARHGAPPLMTSRGHKRGRPTKVPLYMLSREPLTDGMREAG